MNKSEKTILTQYGKNYKGIINRKRLGCRGFITDGDKMLISHETNTDMYLIPGGGLEEGETPADCCKRELLEETGYVVNAKEHFLTINEYYDDRLYETAFFICEIIGKDKQSLTENEINHGVCPEWIKIVDALIEFGKYADYEETEPEKCGQYRREYAAIKYYLENIKKPFTFYQFPENHSLTFARKRPSARGLILKDRKILLVRELKDGTLMSAGGGVEDGESLIDCCKREMLEETGYIVNVKEAFATVDEYFEDVLYIGNYFICEIIGNGEKALTETEKSKNTITEWVDIDEALDIFATYKGLKIIDDGKKSLYKREYTILKKLKDCCL